MLTIQHKMYGEGKVINKEMKENDIILTVQFGDGSERRFAAESFRIGVVTAEGVLKEEIDVVIAAQQAAKTAWRNSVSGAPVVTSSGGGVKTSVKSKKRWVPSCSLAVAYEKYLIANGYSIESDSGNPSTVYSYGNAVEKVIEREYLTWDSLANNIDNIVTKYDEGGPCESWGKKSNSTYINALKRFQEFVSA